MPEERRLHCPNCGSQLWKLPRGVEPETLPELECAKCHVKSPHSKIVSSYHHESTRYEEDLGIGDLAPLRQSYLADKQVTALIEEERLRKQRLKVLERLVEIQHLEPLSEDEKSRVLAGAPVDFIRVQVWKRKPDSWGLYASGPSG